MAGPGRIIRPTSGNNPPRNVNDSGRRNQPFRYVRPMGPENSEGDGYVAVLGTGSFGGTVYVYDLTGTLKWQAETIRHTDGPLQVVNGLCFGSDRDVWVGQSDSISFGVSNHYLYRFDRTGAFVSETVVGNLQPAVKHILRSNSSGQIVVSNVGSTHAQIIGGATCTGSGVSQGFGPVSVGENGDVYATGTGTFNNALTLYRWDSSGTLLESYSPGVAQPRMAHVDVSRDGSYVWLAWTKQNISLTWDTEWRKLAVPGFSVLDTASSSGTPTGLNSMRVTPWGTRLDQFGVGADIDANLLRGKQIVMNSSSLTVNGLPKTLSVTPGAPLFAVAVSID